MHRLTHRQRARALIVFARRSYNTTDVRIWDLHVCSSYFGKIIYSLSLFTFNEYLKTTL